MWRILILSIGRWLLSFLSSSWITAFWMLPLIMASTLRNCGWKRAEVGRLLDATLLSFAPGALSPGTRSSPGPWQSGLQGPYPSQHPNKPCWSQSLGRGGQLDVPGEGQKVPPGLAPVTPRGCWESTTQLQPHSGRPAAILPRDEVPTQARTLKSSSPNVC